MRLLRATFLILVGAWIGLAIYLPTRRQVVHYSEHSLPKPDYLGPKFYLNGFPVDEATFMKAIEP